jgi:hypothetical protein
VVSRGNRCPLAANVSFRQQRTLAGLAGWLRVTGTGISFAAPTPSDNTAAVCATVIANVRADTEGSDLAPIIKELQAAGKTSLSAITAKLNDAGVPTARGGKWSSPQVMRMLERLDPFREDEAAAA